MQPVARLDQTFKADITQISEGRGFESHVGRSFLRNEPDRLVKLMRVDFDAKALVRNYFFFTTYFMKGQHTTDCDLG